MGGDRSVVVVAPSVAPLGGGVAEREQGHLSRFDSSVYAVSFGFVATVVLVLMFLVMAIFERFLRPRSSAAGRNGRDLESQMMFHGKLDYPSPKMTIYAKGVSVLLPGEEIPTFIAHPAPVPCLPPSASLECSSFPGPSFSSNTS